MPSHFNIHKQENEEISTNNVNLEIENNLNDEIITDNTVGIISDIVEEIISSPQIDNKTLVEEVTVDNEN